MTEWRPIETAPKDGTEIVVNGGEHAVLSRPLGLKSHLSHR
jgi:hypothetical protein